MAVPFLTFEHEAFAARAMASLLYWAAPQEADSLPEAATTAMRVSTKASESLIVVNGPVA